MADQHWSGESEGVPLCPPEQGEDYRPTAPVRYTSATKPQPRLGSIVTIALIVIATLATVVTMINHRWPTLIIAIVATISAILIGLRLARGTMDEAKERFEDKAREMPDVPKRVRRILSENGEQVRYIANEHPLIIAPWLLLAAFVIPGCGWLMGEAIKMGHPDFSKAVGIAGLAIMGLVVYKIAEWYRTLFVMTNQYVYLLVGVFGTARKRQPVIALTGVTASTPFYSTLLAWLRIIDVPLGTFTLEDAGQDQAINKVRWLAGIETLEKMLGALARGNEPFLQIDPVMLADDDPDSSGYFPTA